MQLSAADCVMKRDFHVKLYDEDPRTIKYGAEDVNVNTGDLHSDFKEILLFIFCSIFTIVATSLLAVP